MLTATEIAAYKRDGYLFPRRALSSTEAGNCKAKLDNYVRAFGDDARGSGPFTKRAHIILRWAANLVRNSLIVDAVEDIIGPDILCWSSAIFTKEANSRRFVSWHQDASYWGLSSSDVISAWVALTPATPQNGCMRFLPRSHSSLHGHQDLLDDDNMLSRGQTMHSGVDETYAVNVELEAGEFALFHVNMAHSSLPNTSDEDRVGFVFRYIASDVYQTKSETDSATLIRGQDRAGFFEHEPFPKTDLDPDCLEFHARASRDRASVYFNG